MLKNVITLLLIGFVTGTFSQQSVSLSDASEISIITSGPGDNLYEKFGHCAIRVYDPALNLDVIYNYGIFDFNNPNFYMDFTKGYMQYKLAYYPFYISLKQAQQDKRWVKQQTLNLTTDEKNAFVTFLNINALPQNASYLYDPFFNNCATKPRDIIQDLLQNDVIWKPDFVSDVSLRQLMNKEIHQNTWGSLGINLALGNRLDQKATAQEYLYLPDYVFKALESAKINRNGKKVPLVRKTETLLDFKEKPIKQDVINPFTLFMILLLVGVIITYRDIKKNTRTRWFDGLLFFTTGILGLLIVFLWFFTNHSTAPNNFNILWALPFNCIVAVWVAKKQVPKWVQNYILLLLVALIAVPIIWTTKIQLFNWTLIPLFVLLLIRYVFLQKTLKR